MKTKVLLAAVLVAGTALAAPRGASACLNCGIKLNGVSANGLKLNGVRLNGPALNGPLLQGIRFNGIRLNGPILQGTRFNGINFNGPVIQGIQFHGVVAQCKPDATRAVDWSAIPLSRVAVRLPRAR